MNADIQTFLGHLRGEAQYGLSNSHKNDAVHGNNCNARRQLRIIVAAINQFEGIRDGHEIGWANPNKIGHITHGDVRVCLSGDHSNCEDQR